MRNLGLSILALAIATAAAPAQNTDWFKKAFKDPIKDFGNVPLGAQLHHRFPMTNIWAVPLEITQLRASCGCVTPTASTQILKPHETGYIDVTMDARRFTGPKTVTIYVTAGPEYVSSAALQVSAHSRADVVFNPGQVNFGIVSGGQTPVQTIDVEYAGALDWRVMDVITSDAPLEVELKELYRRPNEGRVGYRVKVTLKASAPAGTHKWDLSLKTNDPASPLVTALVEATVQASLSLTPNVLNLQTLKVGETVTQRVVMRGSRAFKIVSVDGTDADVQLEIPTAETTTHVLTIRCRPSQAGELHRQLTIKTELGNETLTVVGAANP